jgi:hypothetical protein
MSIILLGAIVLINLIDPVEFFWRSPPDPTWETRWRALDPNESAWLAVMASSRGWLATLTDPEEIELAQGFRRRESRRRIYVDLILSPLLIAVAALVLIGVLSISALGITLGLSALVRGLMLYRRERQTQKTYQQAKDNYRALTLAEAMPSA